jgi:hypothetical protein
MIASHDSEFSDFELTLAQYRRQSYRDWQNRQRVNWAVAFSSHPGSSNGIESLLSRPRT